MTKSDDVRVKKIKNATYFALWEAPLGKYRLVESKRQADVKS